MARRRPCDLDISAAKEVNQIAFPRSPPSILTHFGEFHVGDEHRFPGMISYGISITSASQEKEKRVVRHAVAVGDVVLVPSKSCRDQ